MLKLKKRLIQFINKKYYFKSFTMLLLGLFCGQFIAAQELSHFSNIQHITSNEGLSQSEVTSIIQDRKGFLWIGTRGGLNRYDGNSFKTFQNEIGNPNSLINNSIEFLFEDSSGNIWIGTKSNGIAKYNPVLNSFKKFSSSMDELKDKNVISIIEGHDNEIWIGTRKNGLWIFDENNDSLKKVLQVNLVSTLQKTSDNKILAGTGQWLFIFDLFQNQLDRVTLGAVSSITEDPETGNYYYASWGGGLFKYNPESKVSTKIKLFDDNNSKLNSNSVHYLKIDSNRNIWVGSWGTGLYQYNINSGDYNHYSLFSNNIKGSQELYNDVLTIFEDSSGNLWFGTNGGGICKVSNKEQFGFKTFPSLPNEPVWSIYKDVDDFIWTGFKGNKHIYYGKEDAEFSKIKIPEPFPNDPSRTVKNGVKVIFQDSNNSIWIGGNYSLYEINQKNGKYTLSQKNIQIRTGNGNGEPHKITTLDQTSDGTFWIGTQQRGLRKSNGAGNPNNQIFESHLNNDRVSAFLEDSSGKIWIGTYTGLLLYNKESNDFKKFIKKQTQKNTLSSDIIICLMEDSKGQIWVGTPNGLNLMIKNGEDISFKTFQVEDGLPNNYIHSILEDNSSNIWISTNKGISKYNLEREVFYNFNYNDGLTSNNFMEGAGFSSKNGQLYFGGNYGLNSFLADSIKFRELPKVTITGFRIAGEEIKAGESYQDRIILNKSIEHTTDIILNHDQNIFSIDYSTLNFNSSSSNLEFMLEGNDQEWQTSNSQTRINYSNLNPGTYTFKIKPVSSSKLTSEPTSLTIKILPPFWKTGKAFLLYIFTFVALLVLYRYYINKQNELKNSLELSKVNRKREEEIAKMKTQFFTNIAHEFRTPLSLISGPVELLLNNNLSDSQRKSHLATIHYHTNRLLGLVNQLLDFRKSETGKMTLKVHEYDFSYFIKEIYLSFQELANSKNIKFDLNVPDETVQLTFDFNKLEIVFSNLLSNAFKYAKSEVNIDVEIINESNCKITVFDDGKGMSKDMLERIFDRFYQISTTESSNLIGTGIGLSLVKNIIELHKGSVKVDSKIGKGSSFILNIPMGNAHFEKQNFIQNFKQPEDSFFYQKKNIQLDLSKDINDSSNSKGLPKMLIVDDNPEIISFTATIFKGSFSIETASNGKLGYTKAIEHIPDIIISDLMMPEMDGLEFTDRIREDKKTVHIPIIMLTARTTDAFQEKGYNSGVDIYVTKPFNPNILKAQVEGLLNSRNKLKKYFGNKINLLPTEDTEAVSMDQEFLNKLIKLVEDNLTNEKMGREFLAIKMSVSPSTLYRKVKAITDLDITIFIRSIRLKRAAQMIRNKEDNISGIAYQVGFNDPKYFRKCFVKQYGVNPSQFNKS